MAYERRKRFRRIQGSGAKKTRTYQKKIHYSVSKKRPICGMNVQSVSRLRTDVTCRSCKHLMRNLGGKAPKKKVAHRLVAIGPPTSRTVYLDISMEEATRRYIGENGDTPTTRNEIERAGVLDINDEFRARDLWK